MRVATGVILAVVVLGAGGYGVADAYDVVPGVVTLEPEPVPPAPFLDISGEVAVQGPDRIGPVADAPMPPPDWVQSIAQSVRDDPRTGNTGILVTDMLTGETLAAINPDLGRVPASTTKTLTAVAALYALGPDHTLVTTATWDADSSRVGLVAGGDMMLSAGYGHGGAINDARGWAGLADLADAVVERLGPDLGSVTVVVDDAAFPGPAYPAEWPSYALQRGYAAPVSGLAVNVARITDENYAQRHRDPSLAAAEDFAQALRERGVDVADVRRGSTSGDDVVAAVESAPLSLIAEFLLHVSDNTVAEVVARVLAWQTDHSVTPAGAAAATVEALEDLGVDTTGLRLFDGAGFSERNRITPRHLVETMALAHEHPHTQYILDYLPVSAAEGTIDGRYRDTDAAGVVRAKTGSLTGVTTLAGAVQTADGRWLWFAIMFDGMGYGQERPQAAADVLVQALAQWRCEEPACVPLQESDT